jgi:alpha-mannosidase
LSDDADFISVQPSARIVSRWAAFGEETSVPGTDNLWGLPYFDSVLRLPLHRVRQDESLTVLKGTLPSSSRHSRIRYETRTGALLRVDGVVAGAFDREHHEVVLPPSAAPRELVFEVELRSLPTNGLPAGPGILWNFLNARASQEPRTHASVSDGERALPPPARGDLRVIGHSHLDVAWLWTYEETRRKAARTFAIAANLLDEDPTFRFAQSQPQLYAFVEEDEPQLFERIKTLIEEGRWDADVAALWVESDCNIPSGESLLRQMLFAHEYCVTRFGVEPCIAWLPDSFGFANTLPQLLAHARIPYFATTKIQWNDTTRFAHPQFVWEGPDASRVTAALIQSYEGGLYPWRIRAARLRNEPLVVGYGDGGGGVSHKMLHDVRRHGTWIRPRDWFRSLDEDHAKLPVHRDELYLEYHRGVYTTHHDLKSANALLERALLEAEELVAWCIAVHMPQYVVRRLCEGLRTAWEIVLRNQFHDVLPGTAIEAVGAGAMEEYARAGELVSHAIASAQQMLPRPRTQGASGRRVPPSEDAGAFVFDNGLVRARVLPNGTITELQVNGGSNVCTQGNVLMLYNDRPRKWEAWNIDAGYERQMRSAKAGTGSVHDGELAVPFTFGDSRAAMRIGLTEGEPFLRVHLDVDWAQRQTLLRVEHRLPIHTDRVTYGTPHGTIERSARRRTLEERAKFEVPGQRFALAANGNGDGLAIFTLDTYGWSARVLEHGGLQLGHSLLRGTTWPDEHADLGTHRFSYAYAPVRGAGLGSVERAWTRFAHEPRVRLFTCDDPALLVVACKPAEDGEGVIVRVRECDGRARELRVRCAARMRRAIPVDGLERATEDEVRIEREEFVTTIQAYGLRGFRVQFD